MSTRLFVSYSRRDASVVDGVVDHLDAAGYDVWRDRELVGGQRWWDEVLHRIRECDAFVFALSPASVESRACMREYEYAVALDKPVLPVLVRPDPVDALLPPDLGQRERIDYTAGDTVALTSMVRALNSLPDPPPLPDPLPDPPEIPATYLYDLRERIEMPGTMPAEVQDQVLEQLRQRFADGVDPRAVAQLLQHFRRREDLLVRVAGNAAELARELPDEPAWQRRLQALRTAGRRLTGRLRLRRPASAALAGLVALAVVGGVLVSRADQSPEVSRRTTQVASGQTAPPSPTPQPAPSPTATPEPETVTLTIPGTQLWTPTGLELARGATVEIVASGEINVSAELTCGPDGLADRPDLFYTSNVIPGVGHGALLGRIGPGGTPFLIGPQAAFVAPAGSLELGVNDLGLDNNAGAWEVEITVTRSAAQTEEVSETFTVPGDDGSVDPGWVDTGIDLSHGDFVQVAADGSLVDGGFPSGPDGRASTAGALGRPVVLASIVGPNVLGGYAQAPGDSGAVVLDDIRPAALLARVGPDGTPFVIGSEAAFTGRAGRLHLGLNDTVLDDNQGAYEVTITVIRAG